MNIIITQNQMCHSLPLLSSSASSTSSLSSKMSFVNKIKSYNGIVKCNQALEYILNIPRGGDIDEESDEESDDESEEEEESEYDLDDDESEEDEGESEYDDEYDSDNEEEQDVTTGEASNSASVASNTKSIIEYDEPLSLSPLTDMGITLGVMVLCNKLDLTNTKIIKMAR